MRSYLFLTIVSLASAVARVEREPTDALETRLRAVLKGLTRLAKNDAIQDTPSADTFEPMIRTIESTLKKCDDTTKVLSEKQKAKLLGNVMKAIEDWRKALSQRQEELNHEDDSQNAALLMAVLNNRRNDTMKEQLKVLQSPEFARLAVTKAILAKPDLKKPLVTQVGAWLDSHPIPVSKAKSLPQGPLEGILHNLRERLSLLKSRRHAADKREAHRQEAFKRMMADKKWNMQQKLQLKFMSGSQHRAFLKAHAMEKVEVDQLEKAVAAIRSHDMHGLQLARDALELHMKALVKAQKAKSGDFLHLLQVTARDHPVAAFSCEFCGAQCIEGCRANGKSFSKCLDYCVSIDPRSK